MDVYLAFVLVFGHLAMKPKLSTICIQSEAQHHSFLLLATKPYPKCSFTERLDIPTEIELKEVISGA